MDYFSKTIKIKKINLIWILAASTPLFIISLFVYRFSRVLQMRILGLAAVVYLGAALLHHYKDRTLTLEIAIEYILIAALALIILQGLFI
ncbi:MAG: hypothetical protein M1142_06720 [Patescibacteria group bacterium]|nr:hypothetical protein [Patescibacteria group bacterium]